MIESWFIDQSKFTAGSLSAETGLCNLEIRIPTISYDASKDKNSINFFEQNTKDEQCKLGIKLRRYDHTNTYHKFVSLGGSYCTSGAKCPACHGDADSDGNCQDGLKVFQR